MWPKGDESLKYELGRTYIFNAGGSPAKADYQVRVCRKSPKKEYDADPRDIVSGRGFLRLGTIRNFPRKSYNVWRLVLRSLRAAFPEDG
jgi:hypothetical protein